MMCDRFWMPPPVRRPLAALLLALGCAAGARAVDLPDPHNYVRIWGPGAMWLEGSTPQSGYIGLGGLDGLGYAVYGAASTSFENGGTVRVVGSLNGTYVPGSVGPSAELTSYIRLNPLPGASADTPVPVRVQASAWQSTPGSFLGIDTLFSLQPWGTTNYLARAGVNYIVWDNQQLFSIDKVVMMMPGTIYSVFLHAEMYGLYADGSPRDGYRRTAQEIVVDPTFTIDPAYAGSYAIEGLLTAVPEPGTAALHALGLGALMLAARRRWGVGPRRAAMGSA